MPGPAGAQSSGGRAADTNCTCRGGVVRPQYGQLIHSGLSVLLQPVQQSRSAALQCGQTAKSSATALRWRRLRRYVSDCDQKRSGEYVVSGFSRT